MKIFISWSGEVSRNMAETLKKWIPCFFESVEVFFSPEDIEKGQNWNGRITEELSNCSYGVVCLTSENKSAPWINFEAGAIAKAFDSRVAALLVDINPSDIQGPLSMYQATKLTENDIHKLIIDINGNLEQPRSEETLNNLFKALWGQMEKDFNEIISNINLKPKAKTKEKIGQDEILESILQEVREQKRLLSNPENFLSKEYVSTIMKNEVKSEVDKKDLLDYTRSILAIIDNILSKENSLSITMLNKIEEIVIRTKHMAENQQINEKYIQKAIDMLRLDIDITRDQMNKNV